MYVLLCAESDRDMQVQDGRHLLRVGVGDDRLDGGEVWLRAGGEHHRTRRSTERVSGASGVLQDRALYGAYACCGM